MAMQPHQGPCRERGCAAERIGRLGMCSKHYQQAYSRKHAEKKRRRAKEWVETNREYALWAKREHHRKNRGRLVARAAEYREQHRDELREKRRLYGLANRDVIDRNNWRRRAKKRAAFVEDVHEVVLLELHDGVCGICNEDVDPFDFHVDHIHPLSLGGFHNYENTQPACPSCNLKKGAQILAA